MSNRPKVSATYRADTMFAGKTYTLSGIVSADGDLRANLEDRLRSRIERTDAWAHAGVTVTLPARRPGDVAQKLQYVILVDEVGRIHLAAYNPA